MNCKLHIANSNPANVANMLYEIWACKLQLCIYYTFFIITFFQIDIFKLNPCPIFVMNHKLFKDIYFLYHIILTNYKQQGKH